MSAAKLLTAEPEQPVVRLDQMSYRISVGEDDGATNVAAVATPGIAFSAYYAAIREYPDRLVRLWQNGRILARSRV